MASVPETKSLTGPIGRPPTGYVPSIPGGSIDTPSPEPNDTSRFTSASRLRSLASPSTCLTPLAPGVVVTAIVSLTLCADVPIYATEIPEITEGNAPPEGVPVYRKLTEEAIQLLRESVTRDEEVVSKEDDVHLDTSSTQEVLIPVCVVKGARKSTSAIVGDQAR